MPALGAAVRQHHAGCLGGAGDGSRPGLGVGRAHDEPALGGVDAGRGQIAVSTATLHAVEPPVAAGRSLPALQDATFGGSLYGWLDILAPALAGMLFAGETAKRLVAAVATGAASLAWGLLLTSVDQIPGTVPPLAAVAVWFLTRAPHERIAVREVTIRPAGRGSGGISG